LVRPLPPPRASCFAVISPPLSSPHKLKHPTPQSHHSIQHAVPRHHDKRGAAVVSQKHHASPQPRQPTQPHSLPRRGGGGGAAAAAAALRQLPQWPPRDAIPARRTWTKPLQPSVPALIETCLLKFPMATLPAPGTAALPRPLRWRRLRLRLGKVRAVVVG